MKSRKNAIIGALIGTLAIVLVAVAIVVASGPQTAPSPTHDLGFTTEATSRPRYYYDTEAQTVIDNAVGGEKVAIETGDVGSKPKIRDFSGLTTSFNRETGWTPTLQVAYRLDGETDESADTTALAKEGNVDTEPSPVVELPERIPDPWEGVTLCPPPRVEILYRNDNMEVQDSGRINFRNGNVVMLETFGTRHEVDDDGIVRFYDIYDGSVKCEIHPDGTVIGTNFSLDADGNLVWNACPDEVIQIGENTTIHDRWMEIAPPGYVGNYEIPEGYFDDPIPDPVEDEPIEFPIHDENRGADAPESDPEPVETASSNEGALVSATAEPEPAVSDTATEISLEDASVVTDDTSADDTSDPEPVSTTDPASESDALPNSGDPVADTPSSEDDALPGVTDEIDIVL